MNRSMRIVLLVSLIGNLTIVYVGYKAYKYREYINFWLDKYETVVDEFSGRQYYAGANEGLRSDTTVPGRVVFLGTQVTKRWGVAAAFPEWEAIDRGIEGQRAAGFLLRFRADVAALRPEAVVIEVSSYNFRPQWSVVELEDYAATIASLAQSEGIAPVFGTVIPPRRGVEGPGDYKIKDSAAVFNAWLRMEAGKAGWGLVDFDRLLADEDGHLRRELSFEAIDPNEAGYTIMTDAVKEALTRLGVDRIAPAAN